jgi:2-oxoglutarate ferredoxin oxidoreductase subunit delta
MSEPRTSRGTLVIDEELCKGCELCISACPPNVLVMSEAVNETGYHYPQLHEGCTGCTACQLVCPDFVFSVYRLLPPRPVDHPQDHGDHEPGEGKPR